MYLLSVESLQQLAYFIVVFCDVFQNLLDGLDGLLSFGFVLLVGEIVLAVLELLTCISDLGQAKRRRRPLEEMAESRKLVEVFGRPEGEVSCCSEGSDT